MLLSKIKRQASELNPHSPKRAKYPDSENNPPSNSARPTPPKNSDSKESPARPALTSKLSFPKLLTSPDKPSSFKDQNGTNYEEYEPGSQLGVSSNGMNIYFNINGMACSHDASTISKDSATAAPFKLSPNRAAQYHALRYEYGQRVRAPRQKVELYLNHNNRLKALKEEDFYIPVEIETIGICKLQKTSSCSTIQAYPTPGNLNPKEVALWVKQQR